MTEPLFPKDIELYQFYPLRDPGETLRADADRDDGVDGHQANFVADNCHQVAAA